MGRVRGSRPSTPAEPHCPPQDGTWDSRYVPEKYARYVEWCEAWGRKRTCRSDDVERALFSIGPTVRHLCCGAALAEISRVEVRVTRCPSLRDSIA
ncbi:hypothetical protein [Mycobacterium sp. 852014-52144_SCH5372336]|uniref:8-oxoguanine DNA glycosylase OGG fold protein n=1 Tax=Mycobacterium sp. 852014-52144_SCH5372336 TaxID=1834115 RepID=UPI00351344C3